MEPIDYYSQTEILEELIKQAQDREIQIWFGKIPGRRPDTAAFKNDILDSVRKGMTSIHISLERWKDPTLLQPGMKKKDLDELRLGWDLLLDIDTKNFEFARLTAKFLVEALNFHDVKDFKIKFSGNKGMHILVPFESFPYEVDGINIKNHFPEGLRTISEYLQYMIKEHLSAEILKTTTIEKISEELNVKKEDLFTNGLFDPYKVIDIDSILISSRHLFRACYSLHEKSGLASIPIKDLNTFQREDAKPENVKVSESFIDRENVKPGSAKHLLVQALDWKKKQPIIILKQEEKKQRDFEEIKDEISEEYFPDCIKKLLEGCPEDGRKRAVFTLVNFLRHMGWGYEKIESRLMEWNEKNYEQLREGYIQAQINWSKKQGNKILPPNCSNQSYYSSMGVKCQENICNLFKNPVNCAIRKYKIRRKVKKNAKK